MFNIYCKQAEREPMARIIPRSTEGGRPYGNVYKPQPVGRANTVRHYGYAQTKPKPTACTVKQAINNRPYAVAAIVGLIISIAVFATGCSGLLESIGIGETLQATTEQDSNGSDSATMSTATPTPESTPTPTPTPKPTPTPEPVFTLTPDGDIPAGVYINRRGMTYYWFMGNGYYRSGSAQNTELTKHNERVYTPEQLAQRALTHLEEDIQYNDFAVISGYYIMDGTSFTGENIYYRYYPPSVRGTIDEESTNVISGTYNTDGSITFTFHYDNGMHTEQLSFYADSPDTDLPEITPPRG